MKYVIHKDGKVYSHRVSYKGKLSRPELKFFPVRKNGYWRQTLSFFDTKTSLVIKRSFSLHRLVATGYIKNPENKQEINHIDGNPANNHVSNLEWCTESENSQHMWDTGLRKRTGSIFIAREATVTKKAMWTAALNIKGKLFRKSSVNREVCEQWLREKLDVEQRLLGGSID